MSRKLEEKQARREAEERRRAENKKAARRRNLVTLGVALLVGALAVGLVLQARNETTQVAQGVAAEEAGCTDVEENLQEGQEHVPDGTPVQYETSVPAGGNHWATPSNADFFSDPVPPETLVHNLEHGQIVIWYRANAPEAMLDAIETYVNAEPIALLATPYDQVPAGANFSMSAWGALQSCENFSAAVVDEFRGRFQGRGPENVGVPQFEAE